VTTAISQGSVAARLRCGGQCDSQFVANFLMNSTMEKFRKSINICQSYGQRYRGPFFDSQCSCGILWGAVSLSVICSSCEVDGLVLMTVWWSSHCEWFVGHVNPCLECRDRSVSAHADWSPVTDQRHGAPRQHPRLRQCRLDRQSLEHHHRTVSADTARFVQSVNLSGIF